MSEATIAGLSERVRGQVITASDGRYEEARKVYNAMIDRRPVAIVRCVDAGDVMAAVDHARDGGLDLSVRRRLAQRAGFRHHDGGVVIDLSTMKGVRVDPHTPPPEPAAAPPGATSTTPPTRSAWPRPAESSPQRASPGSRWAAALVTSCAAAA